MKRNIILSLAMMIVLLACSHRQEEDGGGAEGPDAHPSLKAHTDIFRKGIEKIGDNVYAAIGYGLANSIMIEGVDGLIIVDTMESCEAASEVLAEFRKISDKPVRAIIYTHNHVDHILGAEVFAPGGGVPIYAHETTAGLVGRIVSKMRTVIDMRSMRMFGAFLDREELVNCGIGPFLRYGRDSTIGYLPPTRTFSDTLTDTIAGIEFELVHAPGETDDQIFVWLPHERVLLCGDNFYWAFPNLYTIRGTPYRSLQQWYRSIDRIRDKHPEYLVPGHTRPLIGRERIETVLRDYRDAIQFIHDQAICGINQGMTPDELAEYIKLPPHLAEAPYLQPFYGTVAWSVRSVFSGELGWFDGDSAHLNPLTRSEKARLLVRLAGSEEALQAHTQQALADARPNPEQVRRFPLEGFFELLAVNLNPVASAEADQRVGMRFEDEKTAYVIHVRRGVAEIRQCEPGSLDGMDLDIGVTANAAAFKEMLARIRNPVTTLAGFDYEPGNAVRFARFLALFSPPEPKLPYEPQEQ